MPLYEYRCGDCHAVRTLLAYSWFGAAGPACGRCGGFNVTKLVSRFAFHRSWGDSLNWVPSGETMTDVDEDDPGSLDRFMGRVKEDLDG